MQLHTLDMHYLRQVLQSTVVSYNGFGSDYILDSLSSVNNDMSYLLFYKSAVNVIIIIINTQNVLSFWGMNFKGEVETYFHMSCLCKYLFIYVCIYESENTMNVLRFILDFFLH